MDYLICDKCNYSLVITKENIDVKEKKVLKIQTPEKFLDLVKKIKKENIETEFDIEFGFVDNDLNNLLKNRGINNDECDKIKKVFNNVLKKKKIVSAFIKKCSACDSIYNLDPGTIIYSVNLDKQVLNFNDVNIDLKINDQTLPRTKDYICVNAECITNTITKKDKNYNTVMIEKEAVFYRGVDSYNLKYACCVCKASWLI
jgi:hypothetical protein